MDEASREKEQWQQEEERVKGHHRREGSFV